MLPLLEPPEPPLLPELLLPELPPLELLLLPELPPPELLPSPPLLEPLDPPPSSPTGLESSPPQAHMVAIRLI